MPLSDTTFQRFSQWLQQETGIQLPLGKKALLIQRLSRRLRERQVATLEDYYRLLLESREQAERQIALDLLTTHETYFFREAQHFTWLQQRLRQSRPAEFRLWSAAASTGEEVWSLAMLLADTLGEHHPWRLIGSDISPLALRQGAQGHYNMHRTEGIPRPYLQRFCLKGTGKQQGTLLISKALRQHVDFRLANLSRPLPDWGRFDVVFLRNVLIYFSLEAKQQIVQRVTPHIVANGYLVVGLAESLQGFPGQLKLEAPGIYRVTT